MAKIAVCHVAQEDAELHIQRFVEPEFGAHAGDHVRRGVIANDGDDRIDRHRPADQERHQHQAEQRHGDAGQRGENRTQALGDHALLMPA